jgi:hypothetical protein
MYTNRTNPMTTRQCEDADRALWLRLAIKVLRATEHENGWVYRDDATGDRWIVAERDLLKLGRMLERGDDEATAYSEWCSWTDGELAD